MKKLYECVKEMRKYIIKQVIIHFKLEAIIIYVFAYKI